MHFDKRGGGGGGGGENKRIKGICAGFRCGCQSVFHGNGVLYKNSDQLWLFKFIAIRRVFREPLEPSASGLNNFLQPLQMLIQYKNMVDPFNMYLENIN